MVAEAERVLVEHAATFTPRELRVLGRRILDVVAPEVGEEQERRGWRTRNAAPARPPP